MELHYRKIGEGPPVLILHGLFGMLDNWQTFSRELSNAFTVYTADLRNHGKSTHTDAFSIALMADDIRQFITKHQIGPVLLIGHSLGGKVAMQTALSFPELISRLMVIDIAPRVYRKGHEKIIETLQEIRISEATSRKAIEQELMDALHDQVTVQFLMKNVGRNEDGSLAWKMNLPVLAAKYEETLAGIKGATPFSKDTLFVRGEKSDYIRDEDMSEIIRLFPQARLETVAGAGHWVHADAMEELLEIAREFFFQ